jgi:outer membrane protein OmpA-like peptidoglycan-associated protein
MRLPFSAAILSLMMTFAVISPPACRNRTENANEAKTGKDLAPAKAQAEKSLERLGGQIGALRKALSEVHHRLDELPEDMPDLDDLRSKLLSVEEVFGVEDGRVKWLAGRLNAALSAGSEQQVREVSTAIHDAIEGNKGEVVVELTHQVMELERRVYTHRFSTGYVIKAAQGGIEQGLIELVEDGQKKLDRTSWFTFDRVSFEKGETALDLAHSKLQLDNVVALLAAFPYVKLEIGDFTDNSAPAALNEKLSAARAQSIKKELIARGVAANRLKAQGHGARHPLCPANDTMDCKARNRRIAARMTAK